MAALTGSGRVWMRKSDLSACAGGNTCISKRRASLHLTAIRVERPHASNTERDPRVSWFVWIGDPEVDLVTIGLGYVLRFSHEHGYRFQKQSLPLGSATSAHS